MIIVLLIVISKKVNSKTKLIAKKDEKKYFQMELVNRENNFNKMFNTTPNIGVMNPLSANTKVNIQDLRL
jgi:hypothetical protein